jgi:hypothetical protein
VHASSSELGYFVQSETCVYGLERDFEVFASFTCDVRRKLLILFLGVFVVLDFFLLLKEQVFIHGYAVYAVMLNRVKEQLPA